MESELNSNLKLLAKSSVIVFIGIFLSKLFTYLYKIIIGRYYGPEVYGTFSLALSILGILTAIASLGLIDGLTRFIPIYLSQNKKPHVKFIMDFSKKVLLFTSMTCGVLLFIFSNLIAESWFNLPKLSIYLKIFALAIPFQVIAPIYMNYFRGIEKIKLYSFSLNITAEASKVGIISDVI
jgi:stage V sporulation protein B